MKEAIIHLVLKKKEENLQQLSNFERAELKVAQSSALSKYYNASVGLNDELKEHKDEESKFDKHENPSGSDFDLGKDGEFKEFLILFGSFCKGYVPEATQKPITALKKKGFKVEETQSERDFINKLKSNKYDVAWIISGNTFSDASAKEDFKKAVLEYHQNLGGLFIWGDNNPWFSHANIILPEVTKIPDCILTGDTPGAKVLSIGDVKNKQQFSTHIVTSGVIKLFEGITICYPKTLGPFKVLATSSDNHPVICYADNEVLEKNCGRIVLDCGWTKNYCNWDDAGTARYVVNATIWLLGLEHRVALGKPMSKYAESHPNEATNVVPPVPPGKKIE